MNLKDHLLRFLGTKSVGNSSRNRDSGSLNEVYLLLDTRSDCLGSLEYYYLELQRVTPYSKNLVNRKIDEWRVRLNDANRSLLRLEAVVAKENACEILEDEIEK